MDPYSMFVYAIRSPYTKESYLRRLRRFFDSINFCEGEPLDKRCNTFAYRCRNDANWAFNNILRLLHSQKGTCSTTSSRARLNYKNHERFVLPYLLYHKHRVADFTNKGGSGQRHLIIQSPENAHSSSDLPSSVVYLDRCYSFITTV